MNLIAKKTFNTSIINLIGIGIGAISLLYFQTNFLTEQEVGAMRILSDWSLFMATLLIFSCSNVITKYHFEFKEDKQLNNSFITYVFFIPLIFCLLFTLFFFLFQGYWTSHFEKENSLLADFVFLIPLLVISHVSYSLFEAYLATKSKIIYPAFLKSIVIKVFLIILISMYALRWINFFEMVVAHSFIFTFNSILLYFSFVKNSDFKFNFRFNFSAPIFRDIFIFCLYLMMGTGGGVLIKFVDTIMINEMLKDLGKVGVYSVAFYLAALVEIPKRPLTSITVPIVSEELAKNNLQKVDSLYKKSALNLMIIGGMVFTLIWVNIDTLFLFLGNSEVYSTGKYVVFFIGLSQVFDLSVGINYEIIHNSRHYKWNLILMPFLAIISIITNYFLIKAYGIVGTAMATALSILVFNLIRTALVKIKLGLQPFTYRHLIISLFIALPILAKEMGLIPIIENKYLSLVTISSCVILFFTPLYFMRLSPDLNDLLNGFLAKIFKRGRRN